MNNILKIILTILVIIILFILGYFIGRTPVLNTEVSEFMIRKEFLQELRDDGHLVPLPDESETIAGEVLEFSQSNLKLSTVADSTINISGAFYPEILDIIVNQETLISFAREKDAEIYSQENEEFQELSAQYWEEGKDLSELERPEPFIYEPVDNIEVGNMVNVVVDQNLIETHDNLVAKEVRIMDEVAQYLPQ